MKHLYIQTAFLGDLLLSIPALKAIRQWDAKSEITLICRKGLGGLMSSLGLCDHVLEMDKNHKNLVMQQISGQEFETVFCPHLSQTSRRLAASVKAKKKIGYSGFLASKTFDKTVVRRLDWPEAIRQLQLVSTVFDTLSVRLEAFAEKPETIPVWAQMNLSQLFWSDHDWKQKLKYWQIDLSKQTSYICLAPGSVWETKRWTEESFVEAGQQLSKLNYQILILGSPEERELCERVRDQIPDAVSLAGRLSILESVMVLSRAKALICNDSGAMHMASLLHLPTVAVFGPTVLELGYKPWNPKAQVLASESLLCRPCGQHGGRRCPIGTHSCMKSVSAQQVVKTLLAQF